MTNEPKLWDKLLQVAPPGSVLMGGAVVDWLIGIPVKDYDIFYTYHPGMGLDLPDNWVPTKVDFNNADWVKEHEEAYLQGIDDNGNHPISSVIEYMVDDKHKVQLIGVNYKNPMDHMKNFDHSLTLAAYSKKGLVVSRKVFESYDNKTIKYVSKNFSAEAVLKSKLRAKKKALRTGHIGWNFVGFDPKPQVKQNIWGEAVAV